MEVHMIGGVFVAVSLFALVFHHESTDLYVLEEDTRMIFQDTDRCLNALQGYYVEEIVQATCADFDDRLLPAILKAKNRRVPKKEINQRLDRVLSLAQISKYPSDYLREVDQRGKGVLRRYINSLKKK